MLFRFRRRLPRGRTQTLERYSLEHPRSATWHPGRDQRNTRRSARSRSAMALCLASARQLSYTLFMTGSLTIRLDADQRRLLHRLASSLGQSDSEFVRGLIERGLAAESAGTRLQHLAGSLESAAGRRRAASSRDDWARAIRERNWRD